jgi:membrane-bound lytic murein transglycosylase D
MIWRRIPTYSLFLIALTFIFGCSQPDPVWTLQSAEEGPASGSNPLDTTSIGADSLKTQVARPDVDEALDNAEALYAIGVSYFQAGNLDSAQASYEEGLAVLGEVDLDPLQSPDQAARMDRLLNEIEQDYRLTLIASGSLSNEASVLAFRELFSDLKNFNNLREQAEFKVKEFNKADTAIYDIDIEWNEKVENSLIYLQTVARDKFTTYLENSGAYLPLMEKIFEERGLPHDLVYLPLIESGFKASAYSYAKASGFWQFISSTGKLYGLDHNWWFDERRDFVKSTVAAAEHLKDLYEQFGSWNLALAAYNGGSGRVSREIKKAKTNDFWKLSLHKQTKAYVPLFMAAVIIAKEPQKYGFFPDYQDPLQFDVFKIRKCISLENVSSRTGISLAEIKRLNPELLRGITPPDAKDYEIRLPKGTIGAFTLAYDRIPEEKPVTYARYKVKRGDTLSSIARKYGVSVSTLVSENNIKKSKRIYIGQYLTIPTGGRITRETMVDDEDSGKHAATVKTAVKSTGRYRVREGDTLWKIASSYGISIAELKRYNKLSSNTLYAGRWLKIPTNGSTPQAEIKPADFTYEIYTVRKGDYLNKIASRYGVSLNALKEINGLASTRIFPGMKLKIPSGSSGKTRAVVDKPKQTKELTNKTYTVRRGDTLWKIAQLHGVSLSKLTRWNNLTTKSRIFPGDKLVIYFD